MAAAVPPGLPPLFVNTVRLCLTQCGVDDVDLFNGEAEAQRLQLKSLMMISMSAWI